MKKQSKYLCFINWTFDVHNTRQSGVYLIDNIYIGSSVDVYSRIIQHFHSSQNSKSHNPKLSEYLRNKIISEDKINVSLLSSDRRDERHLVELFKSKGHSLFNIGTTIYKRK